MLRTDSLKKRSYKMYKTRANRPFGIDFCGSKAIIALAVLAMVVTSSFAVAPVSAAANMTVEASTIMLTAGAVNRITFNVTNSGNAIANDVVVSLGSSGSFTSGTSMIVVGGDGSWSLGNLSPGAKSSFTADIYVSPSAVGSLTELDFTFTYVEGGTDTYMRKSIGMSVSNKLLTGASLYPHFSTFDMVAGANNTLCLIIDNVGSTPATNVSITLSMPGASSSSSADSGSTASLLESLTGSMSLSSLPSSSGSQFMLTATTGGWNISRINAGQSVSIPLTIYASPNSMGSIFQFSVALSFNDNLTYVSETKYVYTNVPTIATSSSNIQVGIDDQNIIAGQINNVTVKVKNTADFTAKAVTLQVAMPGSQVSSSSSSSLSSLTGITGSTSSASLVLIGADGSWSLGDLGPGEEREVSMSILATPRSAGSVTSITVSTSYTDKFYDAKQESKSIGLLVQGIVDINILQASTYPVNITDGKSFSLSVNIINLGTSNANGMLIIPAAIDHLSPKTSEKLFVGDVETNMPVSFTVSYLPTGISSGQYTIPISFTYKDDLGQRLDGTLNVPVTITVSTGESNGDSSGTTTSSIISLLIANWYYLAIAVILIVAMAAILRMRK